MTAILATLRYGEIVVVLYAIPFVVLTGLLTGAVRRRHHRT